MVGGSPMDITVNTVKLKMTGTRKETQEQTLWEDQISTRIRGQYED